MRVAVVFDTPYAGWNHPDHERQMDSEIDFVQRIIDAAIARYERA
jgi:hypothetical protein